MPRIFAVGDYVRFDAEGGSIGRVTHVEPSPTIHDPHFNRYHVEWVYGRDVAGHVMTGSSRWLQGGQLVRVTMEDYEAVVNRDGFSAAARKEYRVEQPSVDDMVTLYGSWDGGLPRKIGSMSRAVFLSGAPIPRTPVLSWGDPDLRLSFDRLRQTNVRRCIEGFGHELSSWSPAEWTNAMCGEAGEAANITKKMIRHRDGVRGNKGEDTDLPTLIKKLAKELADTVIYADLTAAANGIDLVEAIREAFNEKSDEIGSPLKL